jgi:hypothetical protein
MAKRQVRLTRSERSRGPSDTAMMRGSPGTVQDAVARRGGVSRRDLLSDQDRGPVSGLGHGTGSKRGRR